MILNKKLNAGASSTFRNIDICIYPTEKECFPIQLMIKKSRTPKIKCSICISIIRSNYAQHYSKHYSIQEPRLKLNISDF